MSTFTCACGVQGVVREASARRYKNQPYLCRSCAVKKHYKSDEKFESLVGHIIGPLPKSTRDKVLVVCRVCTSHPEPKQYDVTATYVLRNLKLYGQVICNHCSLANTRDWKTRLSPYADTSGILHQRQLLQWKCPDCSSVNEALAVNLLRRLKKEGKLRCYRCAMNTPEYKAKKSESSKGRPIAPKTPEGLQKLRDKARELWADPKYRALKIEQIHKQWSDPESQERARLASLAAQDKRTETLTQVFSDPEKREKQRLNSIAVWQDQEYRKKQSEWWTAERRESVKHHAEVLHTEEARRKHREKVRSLEHLEKIRIPIEEIENRIKDRYRFIDRKFGNFVVVQCLKCGKVSTKRSAKLAQECIQCFSARNCRTENTIRLWIEAYGDEFKAAKKTLPSGREIDIVVESLGLGIEYCGLHWHREGSGRGKTYHHEKYREAQLNGIRLLTIFEDEWLERQPQVKNYLASALGVNEHIIAARDCEVEEILADEALEFINAYHIQELNHNPLASIGLYHQEQLVQVMTLSRHHRQNTDDGTLVLSRMCTRVNTTVQGGASKLFRALVDIARELQCKRIISWSDNRWSNGGVYDRLGFELEENSEPDFSYVKNQKRYSKQSLKKTPEERLTGKTEFELRTEQGYDRIWDCGKKRWVFTL